MTTLEERPTFHITRYVLDGTTVVVPWGEIDLAVRDRFRDCLAGCDGDVVVDLVDVTFLDSSGIGVIVGQWKRLAPEGSLTVRNPNAQVSDVLRVVGLDQLLMR